MKNSEKYKTTKERTEAFRYFCEYHANNGCSECALKEHTCSDTYPMECFAYWLDLEAEAEEPLPCPFCGCTEIKMEIVEDMSDGYMSTPKIHCRHCGASFNLEWAKTSEIGDQLTDEQRVELMRKWNTRAVMAAKEVAK